MDLSGWTGTSKACGLSKDDFALMETDGSFNGIGGKVKVNGIRKFETGFELENGQLGSSVTSRVASLPIPMHPFFSALEIKGNLASLWS